MKRDRAEALAKDAKRQTSLNPHHRSRLTLVDLKEMMLRLGTNPDGTIPDQALRYLHWQTQLGPPGLTPQVKTSKMLS